MTLKLFAPLALLLGTIGGGTAWSDALSNSKVSCCAPDAPCCNPPQECCFLGVKASVATPSADCCAVGEECCTPPQACCASAKAKVKTADCCSAGEPCCAAGEACCAAAARGK